MSIMSVASDLLNSAALLPDMQDELAPEAAATAITVAFSGTTGPELNADILRTALASLVGPSNTPAALRPSG